MILPIPIKIKLSTGTIIDPLDVTLRKHPKLLNGTTIELVYDFKLLSMPTIEVLP